MSLYVIVSQYTEFVNYESKYFFYEKEKKNKLCFLISACSRIEENESLIPQTFVGLQDVLKTCLEDVLKTSSA